MIGYSSCLLSVFLCQVLSEAQSLALKGIFPCRIPVEMNLRMIPRGFGLCWHGFPTPWATSMTSGSFYLLAYTDHLCRHRLLFSWYTIEPSIPLLTRTLRVGHVIHTVLLTSRTLYTRSDSLSSRKRHGRHPSGWPGRPSSLQRRRGGRPGSPRSGLLARTLSMRSSKVAGPLRT